MAPYDLRTSQLGMVSGIKQSASDMVLAVEPATLFSPEARKGRLTIVVEVSQDIARGHDASDLVARTIRKIFYEDSSYSITSSLRKAISAANKALYQQNFNAPAAKRAVVGVTCAVIKDRDFYIAQVLPTQAYLLNEGKLRALPTSPSWNAGQTATLPHFKLGAIGSSLTIEPDFYRAILRPGDSLLICSSNLSRILGQEDVQRLLRSPDPDSVIEGISELCTRNSIADAHALAMHFAPPLSPSAQAAPLSRAGVIERGWLVLRGTGDKVARLTGEAALLFRGQNPREQRRKTDARRDHAQREKAQMGALPEEPPPIPTTIPPVRPLDLGESLEERVEQEREERHTRLGAPPPRPPAGGLPPSAFLGEGEYYAPQPQPERRVDLSDTPGMAAVGRSSRWASEDQPPIEPTLKERMARPFEQAADAITSLGRKRRLQRPPPSAMPRRRKPGLSYRREGPPFPWLWLLTLITLVAVLIVYGNNLIQQNTRNQAADLLAQAQNAVRAVQNAPPAGREQALEAAATALEEVRASGIVTTTQEGRERFAQLERIYEDDLAAIRKLTYFDDLTPIGTHPQAAAGSTFSQLVVPPPPTTVTNTVGFSSIYALDANNGVMYRMPKEGGPMEPFLNPNDTIDGEPVGQIRSIAWRLDNVVAVAQSGEAPFGYYFRNGDRWSRSNLGGSNDWNRSEESRFRITTYDGNLYIWGAASGQILRYYSGNFGDLYDPWIKDVTRKTDASVDLAIDGDIYLLQPDGRMLVYNAGAFKSEIEPPDVNPRLVTASGFFISTEGAGQGYIFIVDTVNGRIIQLDKQTGAFLQQIRARPNSPVRLDLLNGLYVDEKSGPRPILYMINGSQILRASLPTPPQPLDTSAPAEPTAAAASPEPVTPEPTGAP